MSLPLGTIAGVNWLGNIVALPIRLCTPIDQQRGPREVRIDIPWTQSPYNASSTNSNVGVFINLNNQQVVTPLEAVRFVKIDNSFNDVAVYMQFDDTLDPVICPPNSIVGIPVMSNTLNFKIYGTGFFTGRSPVTSIFLSNAPQDAYYIPGTGSYRTYGALTDFMDNQTVPVNINAVFGPCRPGRVMAICWAGERSAGSGNPVTAASIGGAGTIEVAAGIGALPSFAGIAYNPLTQASSGAITLTLSVATLAALFIWVYAVYDTTNPVPFSSNIDAISGTNNNAVATIDVIPGGFALSVGVSPTASSLLSVNMANKNPYYNTVQSAISASDEYSVAKTIGVVSDGGSPASQSAIIGAVSWR